MFRITADFPSPLPNVGRTPDARRRPAGGQSQHDHTLRRQTVDLHDRRHSP